MNCPKCNKAVTGQMKYCPNCQTMLNGKPEPSTVCPKCKKAVPANAKYCPSCQTMLGVKPENPVSSVACPKCKKAVPANAKYCPACQTAIVPVPAQNLSDGMPEQNRTGKFRNICSVCGIVIPESMNVCPSCGKSVVETDKLLKCNKCGTMVPPNVRYCPSCQNDLSLQQAAAKKERKPIRKEIWIILLLVLAALAAAAIAIYLLFLTPKDRLLRELENQDYADAAVLLDSIDHPESDTEIQESIEKMFEEIYQKYVDRTATYEETIAKLENFQNVKNEWVSDLAKEYIERVKKLETSRGEFEAAEQAYAEKEYYNALNHYQKVDKIDEEHYDAVQKKIPQVVQEYKDSMIVDMEGSYENLAYQTALETNARALDAFQEDTETVAELQKLRKKYLSTWIQEQREKQHYFAEEEGYEGAVYLAYQYDMMSMDETFDIDGLIEEGLAYETAECYKNINNKRKELSTDDDVVRDIVRNEALDDIANKMLPDGVVDDKVDEEKLWSLLEAYYPNYDKYAGSIRCSTMPGFSSANNLFNGENRYYGVKKSIEECPEFNKDYKQIGIGMSYDKEQRSCEWLVICMN